MLKFFSKGFSAKELEDKHTRELLEYTCWNPPPFGTQEIRVLMCQEVSALQEVVLFDSQQQSMGPDYPSTDSPSPSPSRSTFKSSSMSSMNSLFGSFRGERSLPSTLSGSQTMPTRRSTKLIPSIIPKLMFGTTPLAYKGSSTKIHLLNEPAQVMLTKTFSIHPNDIAVFNSISNRRGSFSSNTSSNTPDIAGLTTVTGVGDFRSLSRATSRGMPSFTPDQPFTRDEWRNSMTPSTAPNSPNIRPKGPRPGFDVRRLRRASQTSMENGTFNPTPLPSSFSHLDSLGNAKPALTQAARPKSFSIAVFIEVNSNVRLREFIFSHFALIESRLHHLQALCLELLLPACRNRIMMSKGGLSSNPRSIPDFTRLAFQQESRLTEAVMRFQQSLYELYSAPRIQAPLWLNINTYPSKRSEYSASFMTELVHLMQESPSSSRLVAEAISAVLSYHVSWVPTIAPANQELIRANTQGAYDPLWAQLSDLYGNIGTFSRVSRTIVVGSNASFVRRLLYLLSYFIRCNEVFLCVTEFKDEPESLLSPPKATRNPFDLHEDEESGSPATMMRSISIPKRPKIDTFASRGSVISRSSVSSRLTSIGEPTTPVLPNQLNQQGDRPLTPLTQSRPLFDTTRPRLDNKDSPSSGSTPCQSRPTTPTTIESRPDSDRVGEEQGSQQQQQQQQYQMATPDHHLRADISRSRTVSSENAESGTLLPNKDDNTREVDYSVQDVLMDVPIPLPRVVCSYPPYPTSSSSPLSNVAKCSILPATNGVSSAVLSSSELSGAGSGSGSGSGVGMGPGAGIGSVSGSGLGLGIGSGPGSPSQDGGAILPADVLFCKSYGRSLMAPYCDHYMPDFALMGVPKCDFLDPMEADMRDTMRHFELQEKVASATCIVADANTWKCNVYSARSSTLEAPGDRMDGGVTMQSPLASLFLDSTLQQMVNLANNGIAAEHCLNYLEDRLHYIYQCSRMLSTLVRDKELMKGYPTLHSLAPLLGLDRSDMTLLLSVSSTYDDLPANMFSYY